MQKLSLTHSTIDKPAGQPVKSWLFRRVWLPAFIYEAMPLIYIACGLLALSAALFLPGWTWILPWLIIFGVALMHLGLGILGLRHRFRRPVK